MTEKIKAPVVTLVDSELAEEGYEFIHDGIGEECKKCNLLKICSQLEKGVRYRVKTVRPKKHDCKLSGEKVSVVEVEKAPFFAAIRKDFARGSAVVKQWRDECNIVGCRYDHICFPQGFVNDKTYKIIDTEEEYTCPDVNIPLVKVLLKETENTL